ncbi:MAG: T9SS type A sorting domain-containing protein [Bacteroidales bacterium]|nr:T9SS type A sorting domain-containing protein [Bacteroidales bacterium]
MKKLLLVSTVISILCINVSAYAAGSMNMPRTEVSSLFFQENPEPEVEIYPNPLTEGRLTIAANDQILSVQVLNITGEMVFNREYQPGTHSVIIELNQAEKGLYLVRVNFSNKVIHTEKIMVK